MGLNTEERSVYDCSGFIKPKSRPTSGGNVLHAPASVREANHPDPTPLCVHMGAGGRAPSHARWYDNGAIPRGYYDECPKCVEVLQQLPEGWIP